MASVQCDGGKQTTKEVTSKSIPHNYRLHANYSNKDIDLSRTKYNQVFGCKTADEARNKFLTTLAACDAAHPPLRVKKDRKTGFEICIPSPRENLDPEKEREFYAEAYKEMEDLFSSENVIYGVSHFDEIHKFYGYRDKQWHTSRSGLHILIITNTDNMDFIPDEYKKGVNMGAFYRRGCFQPNIVNERLDAVCQRVFGFNYQDGTKAKGIETIEQLKAGSEELGKQQREIEKRQRTLETQDSLIQDKQDQIDEAEEKAVQVKAEAEEYAIQTKTKADTESKEIISAADSYATERKAEADDKFEKMVVIPQQMLDEEYERIEKYKQAVVQLQKDAQKRFARIDSMELNNNEFFDYIKAENPELYQEIKLSHKEYKEGLKKAVEIQPINAPQKSEEDFAEQARHVIQHYKYVQDEYDEMQEQKEKLQKGMLPVDQMKQEREIPNIADADFENEAKEK